MVSIGFSNNAQTYLETVSALRSFQQTSRLNADNPSILETWIQRHTNEDTATDFSFNAAIAILHYTITHYMAT